MAAVTINVFDQGKFIPISLNGTETVDRLRKLIYSRFGSVAEFSRVSGICASSLSRYFTRKGCLSVCNLEDAFDIVGSPMIALDRNGKVTKIASSLSDEEKFALDTLYWSREEVESFEDLTNTLDKQVFSSLNDTSHKRAARLKSANKKPEAIFVQQKIFKRNPDVIAEVLSRSKGICERCQALAPFVRAKDETPYLEVHHKIQLSKGGEDTVENAIALCPNCHRELHYGF